MNKTANARIIFLQIGLAALIAADAHAVQIPSTAEPSRIEQQFDTTTQKRPPSVELRTPAPAPGVSQEMQRQLARKRFVLKKVDLIGNTVYSESQLSFAWKDMAGKEISLADAQTIVKRITDHYRGNEYILSQAIVPSQNIQGGTLKIRVVEGFISDVKLGGDIDEYGDRELLESYATHIKSQRPIKISDLERYMLLMDDLPGASARGVVRPSPNVPGGADLVVDVEHETIEASYSADNRGSKFVGPFQHTGILIGNSLFGLYDRTALRFITTSPTKELRFFDLQHEQQIGDEGTRLVGTIGHSHTKPGDSLKAAGIVADSEFLQLKAIHPFLRSRPENLVGRFVFDARNTDTDSAGGAVNVSEDRLRVIRAGGNYDFADHLAGVNLIDGEISQGLNIFNESEPFEQSRAIGETAFTKLNLEYIRTQPLGAGFSIYTAAAGQYSFDPLLPSEQFVLGGVGYGRAYDAGELAGDHGLAGKVELRYGGRLDDPLLDSYQLYGFYDIGTIWIEDAPPATEDEKSLAATGAGLRANFSYWLTGDFQVAVPLTREASNQGGHAGGPRLFFSVTARY